MSYYGQIMVAGFPISFEHEPPPPEPEPEGNEVFVAQNSAGNGSGTSFGNRMSVASHNASSFLPGDLILLCGGNISSQVVVPSSGNANDRIMYTRYPSNPGILVGDHHDGSLRAVAKEYLWIDGVHVRDGNSGIHVATGSKNILITRNDVRNMSRHGIVVSGAVEDYAENITVGGSPGYGNYVYAVGDDTNAGDYAIVRTNDSIISYNFGLGDPNGRGTDGVLMELCSRSLIEYNDFSNHLAPGPVGEDGIDVKGSIDVIIRRNICNNNNTNGIQVNYKRVNNSCDRVVVYHNLCLNNRYGFVCSGSAENEAHDNVFVWGNVLSIGRVAVASIGSQGDNIHFYNNTLYDAENPTKGTMHVLRGSNFFIKNNILVRLNSTRQIWESINVTGLTIDNNLYWYAGGTSRINLTGSWEVATTVDTNGIEADPAFVNAGANDFRLSAGSPAIAAGADINVTPPSITVMGVVHTFNMNEILAPTTDWNVFPPVVNTVVQTTNKDLGAYAYIT